MHSNFDRSTSDAPGTMQPFAQESPHPEKILSHHDLALPEAGGRPFSTRGWVFELKYDGYRCLGRRFGSAQMVARDGRDLSSAFPEVVRDLDRLPPDSAIDGELVVLDAQGRPEFDALLARSAAGLDERPATFVAWDILMLAGKDLRGLTLLQRKTTLKRALHGLPRINYMSHVPIIGKTMHAQAVAEGFEGIVAKRSDSVYTAGPTADWVKIEGPGGASNLGDEDLVQRI
jgi:bifunctional non-homologous end joining protein LigD